MSAEQHTFQSESHMRSKVQPDYSPTVVLGFMIHLVTATACRGRPVRRTAAWPVINAIAAMWQVNR